MQSHDGHHFEALNMIEFVKELIITIEIQVLTPTVLVAHLQRCQPVYNKVAREQM